MASFHTPSHCLICASLRVTGTATQVQDALFVNLFYRARADGSQYVATDRELSLNLSVPVLEINGLGDAVMPVSLNGTGVKGSLSAADLRNAYLGVDSPFQALDGSGQHVGIVGFVTFTGPDVTGYFGKQVPVQGEISPLPAPKATVVETESTPVCDDLRGDSTATADVFLKNGGQFTVTLKAKNAGDWENGSTHGPLDFAIPDTVTLPTVSEGLASVRINLIQGGSFPETADNWDISTLQVSLFNPGGTPVCQLKLAGTAKLQDGSIGLVRLSQSAGKSGAGPSSPEFKTGPGSGC